MSELVLVRHGQASFGAASYDKLSDLGVTQVQHLCRHWQSLGERFDHLYSGTLVRQRETADQLLPLLANQDAQPQQLPELNEYHGDPLIRAYLRQHARDEGFNPAPTWPLREERLFQRVFEAATTRWINNELEADPEDEGFESWSQFRQRVHQAIDSIMARHRNGSRVLISTSGGVIAMTLQRVLEIPDRHVISTNWMVHNSSVTRIKYGGGKLSLTQFNSLPHLEQVDLRQLITYR